MRANLDLTNGLVVSEAVMMALGPKLGRQRAHDLVYDHCREALKSGRMLHDVLADDPEISKHMSKAELTKLTDPANYVGLAGEMVDRVLAIESRQKQRRGSMVPDSLLEGGGTQERGCKRQIRRD